MEEVYEIVYEEAVFKHDLPQMSEIERTRIQKNIVEKLKTAPEHFGKPLRYSLKNTRSLRVGNCRVLYHLKGKLVTVYAIFRRNEGYKDFESRLDP